MTTLSSPLRAVSITIGTSLLFLSVWQTAMPLVSGSIMSSRTRSKEPDDRKLFSAASPSPTASTFIPSRSKARSRMLLIATSSSTRSILVIYDVCLCQLDLDSGADPFVRSDRDHTSHTFGKLSTDKQPQSKAFRALVSSIEALEDIGEIIRAYPVSLILHDNSAVVYTELYLRTLVRVLYGVVEQGQ